MSDVAQTPEYTSESFWEKLSRFAQQAGQEVVFKALQLYYCLEMDKAPPKAKAIIVGALGYFILPVDAVPDVLPAVGYVDDLGALAAAFATVAVHIDQEVVERAKEKLRLWFGEAQSAPPDDKVPA